jgi:hypothetical protein
MRGSALTFSEEMPSCRLSSDSIQIDKEDRPSKGAMILIVAICFSLLAVASCASFEAKKGSSTHPVYREIPVDEVPFVKGPRVELGLPPEF